ncbi:hypothetical protein [Dictyobacter aurantiacus]|uniref:DUF4760 domain-containing protein n=1 Tax=Dictyobacter aurantiacus TaxID=1936993 RepID=A0A401ZQP9_9CHLR|nr:hypothetical protein [Dictyobacter aurantiacus]GCE09076.1 hypothetical protein KDAU_64050 [Dictyobacter aurantiacus]
MTLNDWVSIATIVQTFFVAVSLGFIWYQLREAVLLTRTANGQRQTERAGHWQLQVAQDEQLAELWLQGTRTPDALSEVHLWRYQRLFMYVLNIYAETYHQWSEKQFDDADYSTWRIGLDQLILEKGFAYHWSSVKESFDSSFVHYVDRQLKRVDPSSTPLTAYHSAKHSTPFPKEGSEN